MDFARSVENVELHKSLRKVVHANKEMFNKASVTTRRTKRRFFFAVTTSLSESLANTTKYSSGVTSRGRHSAAGLSSSVPCKSGKGHKKRHCKSAFKKHDAPPTFTNPQGILVRD